MVREGLEPGVEFDEHAELAHGVLALLGPERGEDLLGLALEIDVLEIRALAHDQVHETVDGVLHLGGIEGLADHKIALLAIKGDLFGADVLKVFDAFRDGLGLVKLRRVHIGDDIEQNLGRGRGAHGEKQGIGPNPSRIVIAGPCTAPLFICSYPLS